MLLTLRSGSLTGLVELRSPTDSLEELQAKMQEYMDNGARLGSIF
jgi:Uma2 family endonuclease